MATDRQFGDHQGDAYEQNAGEINEQEHRAAILAGDIGEAPDIADADGATDAGEYEAVAAGPLFACHCNSLRKGLPGPPQRRANRTTARINRVFVPQKVAEIFARCVICLPP